MLDQTGPYLGTDDAANAEYAYFPDINDSTRRGLGFEVESETKRRYLTFLHEETAKFIREEYLPYRNKFVEMYDESIKNFGLSDLDVEEWKQKLIQFDRDRLRREIKETAKKVIGREIELYDLRKF